MRDAGLAVLLGLLLVVGGLIALTYLWERDQALEAGRPSWDVDTQPMPAIELIPRQRAGEPSCR